jgi:hypothetical protein
MTVRCYLSVRFKGFHKWGSSQPCHWSIQSQLLVQYPKIFYWTILFVSDWAKAQCMRPKRSTLSPIPFSCGSFSYALVVTDIVITVRHLQQIRTPRAPESIRSISTVLILSNVSYCQLTQTVITVSLYTKASFDAVHNN